MDKYVRPQVFSVKVDSSVSSKIWLHWKRTLQSYLRRIEDVADEVKLDILVSLLDTSVYMYIADCPTIEAAIARLDEVYVKLINEVFARHELSQCFSTFFASRTTLCNKKILGNTKQNFIITIMMFSSVLALLIY